MADSDCPPMTDQDCSCTSSITRLNNQQGFKIFCQKDDQRAYYISVDYNIIELQCLGEVPYEPNMFKDYGVKSATKSYFFESCPLPNLSISNLLNNPKIYSLSFTCGQCQYSDVINPEIFVNQTNLKRLTLNRFNFKIIPDNLFGYTKNLVSIRLDFNQIEIISDLVFENLSNLENLSMSNNNLVAIPVNLFRNLTKLKLLYLNDNKLTYISKETLRDLISLEVFNVKNNILNKLDPFTFFKNVLLTELNMGGNSLARLEAFSLANVSNIVRIDLSSNTLLTNINEKTFGDLLPNLTDLFISNCNVTTWPETIFDPLPKLTHLDLSANGFDSLPENIFRKTHQLLHLELSFNNLTSFPTRIFSTTLGLQNLNLRKNNFKSVPKDSFANLSGLQTLKMDNNYLEKICDGDFDDLSQLKTLSLSSNFISSIPGHGDRISGLNYINLSRNYLTELAPVTWDIHRSLSNLDLSYNHISNFSIPRLYSKFTEVNLMYNQIRYVDCQDIRHLDDANYNTTDNDRSNNDLKNYRTSIFQLSSNPFQCDCDLMKFKEFADSSDYPYRKTMFPDIRNYQCNEPDNLQNLTVLNVPENLFICPVIKDCPTDCHCYLQASGNITIANCSKSNRTALPLILPFNTTVLNLKNNYITSLNGMKESSWNILLLLYLDNNYLSSLDFKLPPSLKMLTVTGNNLTSIPQALSTFLTTNRVNIKLGNNPWDCNCSAKTLRNLLSFRYESVGDFLNVTCDLPTSLRGRTMENITEAELCPTDNHIEISYVILAVIAGVAVVIAFVLCILYYRNKRTIVAYLYIHYFRIYSIFFKEDFDEDKYYHAFVSYSSADRDVALQLVEELENKEPGFKLCIHERDWQPGNLITFNIIHSVQNSRRTILVLSENFIKSIWFQLEFRIAYYQMLEDKIDRLIVIVKGELPDKDSLDDDLQMLLTTKTYLQWGEKWFWEKLKYALPHRDNVLKSRGEIYPNNPCNALVTKIQDAITSLATQSAQPATNYNIIERQNNNELNQINENMIRSFGIEILNNGKNNNAQRLEPMLLMNESSI